MAKKTVQTTAKTNTVNAAATKTRKTRVSRPLADRLASLEKKRDAVAGHVSTAQKEFDAKMEKRLALLSKYDALIEKTKNRTDTSARRVEVLQQFDGKTLEDIQKEMEEAKARQRTLREALKYVKA